MIPENDLLFLWRHGGIPGLMQAHTAVRHGHQLVVAGGCGGSVGRLHNFPAFEKGGTSFV